MKSTNNKILIWIIALLAIFNVTTLSTIGVHLYQSRIEVRQASAAYGQHTEGVQYNGRFFKDSLNLSSEQMDQFRMVNRTFRVDVNQINSKLMEKKRLMMQNMASQSPDTLLLNHLSDSIGYYHARLKRDTYRYYLGIKAICDSEQQAKLDAIFQTIFSSEALPSCNGKGQGRYQHGRGRNAAQQPLK